MHVSNGFPHMLTSNQRGRGHDPVTVVGSGMYTTVAKVKLLVRELVPYRIF